MEVTFEGNWKKKKKKAVELKYPKAYMNLGKCYQNGVGEVWI